MEEESDKIYQKILETIFCQLKEKGVQLELPVELTQKMEPLREKFANVIIETQPKKLENVPEESNDDGDDENEEDDEEDEGEEDSDSDDDDGPPPPPPPAMDMDKKSSKDEAKEVEFMKKILYKKPKTKRVKIGKLPKKKYEGSIFKEAEMMENIDTVLHSGSITKILAQHFLDQSKETEKEEKKKKGNEKKLFVRKNTVAYILNGKKSMNASIVLTSVKKYFERFIADLESFDLFSSFINKNIVQKLEKLLKEYTHEEENIIRNVPKDIVQKTSPCDAFLHKLFHIPFCRGRIDAAHFIHNYEECIKGFKKDLQKVDKCCVALRYNEEFQAFLGYVLAIINWLNHPGVDDVERDLNVKDLMFGFNVRTLNVLSQVEDSLVKGLKLIDLVYEIIHTRKPEILQFPKSLSVVREAVGIHTVNIVTGLEGFEFRVEKIDKLLESVSPEVAKKLESKVGPHIKTCKKEILEIKKQIVNVEENLNVVCRMYAQEIDQLDDFLKDLSNFLLVVEKAESKFKRRMRRKNRKKSKKQTKKVKKIKEHPRMDKMYKVYTKSIKNIRNEYRLYHMVKSSLGHGLILKSTHFQIGKKIIPYEDVVTLSSFNTKSDVHYEVLCLSSGEKERKVDLIVPMEVNEELQKKFLEKIMETEDEDEDEE